MVTQQPGHPPGLLLHGRMPPGPSTEKKGALAFGLSMVVYAVSVILIAGSEPLSEALLYGLLVVLISCPFWIGIPFFILPKSTQQEWKKAVMFEATGQHTKALKIAQRYAQPGLIAAYRSHYRLDHVQPPALVASMSPQVLVAQPQIQSIPQPVVHIHNTNQPQGPTVVHIQDSVVTDTTFGKDGSI